MKALKICFALLVMALMVGGVMGQTVSQKPAGFVGSLREDPDGNLWRYNEDKTVTLVVISLRGLFSNPLLQRQSTVYYYYADEDIAREKCKTRKTSLWVDPDATTDHWFCVPDVGEDPIAVCKNQGYTIKDTDCSDTSCQIARDCSETDSADSSKKGTTTGFSTQTCKDETYDDYCLSDDTLVEYACVLNEPYELKIVSSSQTCIEGEFVDVGTEDCEVGDRYGEECIYGGSYNGEKVWQYSYTEYVDSACNLESPNKQCAVGELCDINKGGCYAPGTDCKIGYNSSQKCTLTSIKESWFGKLQNVYVYSYHQIQPNCSDKYITQRCDPGVSCSTNEGCGDNEGYEDEELKTCKIPYEAYDSGLIYKAIKGVLGDTIGNTLADIMSKDHCSETKNREGFKSADDITISKSLCRTRDNCNPLQGYNSTEIKCTPLTEAGVEIGWIDNLISDKSQQKVCFAEHPGEGFSFQKILDWIKTQFNVSDNATAWLIFGGLIVGGLVILMLLLNLVSPKR